MQIVNLKSHKEFLPQYVELRNRYKDLLLSSEVDCRQTEKWLEQVNAEIIAAVEEDKLLGVAILYLDKAGEIAFFVDEPNKGIGTRLLEATLELAKEKKLTSVWAWVLEENAIAQAVFEKKGFIKEALTKREYKGKEKRGYQYRKYLLSYEHTQERYGIREEAKEFPMMCVISFVYVCNAMCPNCPYNNSNIRASYKDAIFMSEDVFKIIARQCGEYNSFIRISGGGEPLLHPQAIELIEYAKESKAKVGLITNGSLFDEEKLTRLILANVDMIEFSVDASDSITYKAVRPGLCWEKLLKNVKLAVMLRNKYKSITKIIVSVINQKGVDVEKAKDFWSKLVDEVQIRKFLTWGYVKDLSADPTPYLPPQERIPCPWLFERLNIDTRGDVTICGEDIAFKEKFANVKEKSIKEIWYHPKLEYFRKMHLKREGDKIPLCSKCPDWQYRSWRYNYWRIVKNAEEKRKLALSND